MQREVPPLVKLKAAVELQLAWGEAHTWTNQDFTALSEQVFSKTNIRLSPSTLKRLWGKVSYSSKPSITTLDTLARFSGYESWRDFKLKAGVVTTEKLTGQPTGERFKKFRAVSLATIFTAAIALSSYFYLNTRNINPDDYRFSSKTVVTSGVPNSVIFDFNAFASPSDSVIIQQSWNQELQTKVPKNQKQHTSIYYYPNNFIAKLIVGDRIVKEHNLLIRSNGWLPLIEQKPVPVYLVLSEVKRHGKLEITASDVTDRNISLSPVPPTVMFTNVRDFGEIYTDNFVFETAVKNTYTDGAGSCQTSSIFLYCVGSVIKIPLSTKGCVSNANLMFTDIYKDGKKENLSAFGVDFSDFVTVKIESANGTARIFTDNRLAYTISEPIKKAKIVGISCRFAGSGAIDYVKLSNRQLEFNDDF